MADEFDSKFSHGSADFPMEMDENIEWRAQVIESASRIYRAAKRKNASEMALKQKKNELYVAIEEMFKYVKYLKVTELADQLRYIEDVDPTLPKKRAKAYRELETVNNEISRATWDKKYKRPRE